MRSLKRSEWFYQRELFGLGNFVMATPALRIVAERRGGSISVFFETPSIGTLYERCPFIKVLLAPQQGIMLGATRALKRLANESETEGYCRIFAKVIKPIAELSTYVDNNITKKLNGDNNVAIFHGCLGEVYLNKKDIGKEARQYMIDGLVRRGMRPVLLGTNRDKQKYWRENDVSKCSDFLGKLNLKDSVSLLSQCKFFMSNDTGLYHVSGALKKPGLVIWHKTDPIKNKSTFNKIRHVVSEDRNVKYMKLQISKYLDEIS